MRWREQKTDIKKVFLSRNYYQKSTKLHGRLYSPNGAELYSNSRYQVASARHVEREKQQDTKLLELAPIYLLFVCQVQEQTGWALPKLNGISLKMINYNWFKEACRGPLITTNHRSLIRSSNWHTYPCILYSRLWRSWSHNWQFAFDHVTDVMSMGAT